MTNDQLHENAVKYLLQRQRNATETNAKGVVKSYNQRRREATAKLQPILTQIWDALERGESVGGHCGKEDWASSQSITIRQIQRIIVGTPQKKRHDVALKVGMTVTVDGVKVVLTQALIDLLVPTPKKVAKKKVKTVACKLCGYKKCQCAEIQASPACNRHAKLQPTAILHAKKTGWGNDGTLCGAPLTWHDGVTGPSDESNNVGTGKSVNCPKCLEKRTARAKKANETRAVKKALRNDPTVQAFLAEAATV